MSIPQNSYDFYDSYPMDAEDGNNFFALDEPDCPQEEIRKRLQDDGDEHHWGILYCPCPDCILVHLHKCCGKDESINIK